MIPKIIHYCWFGHGEMNHLARRCLQSWQKHLPDYEIRRWDESTFDVTSTPYVDQAYKAKKYAFVADYVRLIALQSEGGIYMDTDVEVLQPFDRFLSLPAFAGFDDPNSIGTGLLASEKNGEWVGDFLRTYDGRIFLNKDGTFNLKNNVDTLRELMTRKGVVLTGDKIEIPGYLTVFPKEYFSPKTWNDRGCMMTTNTYAIHHFDGSWLPPAERRKMWLAQRLGAKMGHRASRILEIPGSILDALFGSK